VRVVVLMQNSGLPEAGDAVLTLPPALLAGPDVYGAAVALPQGGTEAERERAARTRRDLAVEGFLALRDAADAGDPEPLTAFHRAAAALVRPRVEEWRARWDQGAAVAAAATAAQLDALGRGESDHLEGARVHEQRPVVRGWFGMRGRLDVYRV